MVDVLDHADETIMAGAGSAYPTTSVGETDTAGAGSMSLTTVAGKADKAGTCSMHLSAVKTDAAGVDLMHATAGDAIARLTHQTLAQCARPRAPAPPAQQELARCT